jgi:mTERF domain-containing protein
MLASCWRRQRLLHICKIPGGDTNPLRSISGAIPFTHTYASTAVSSELSPGTISYLISCGLSPAAAAKATTQKICSTDNVDDVCALFRDYGFTDADIARTVRVSPETLTLDPERFLRPKLDFFASLGFDLCRLATVAYLLARSLDKHLVPSIHFIRDIIGNDDCLRLTFFCVPRALTVVLDKYICPAVEALCHRGFTEVAISKLLVVKMSMLMASLDRISETCDELEAIGMHISDSRFANCFSAMCNLRATLADPAYPPPQTRGCGARQTRFLAMPVRDLPGRSLPPTP